MSPTSATALRPLWLLASGVAAATAGSHLASVTASKPLHWALILLGGTAVVVGIWHNDRRAWMLWLAAGLAVGGGRGLQERAHQLALEQRVAQVANLAVRIEATVRDGWRPSRWGTQAAVTVASASHRDQNVVLPRRCRLEVRGKVLPAALPPPGTTFEALAAIRGSSERPLLVVSSPRLLQTTAEAHGLPRLRERCVQALLRAAGTRVERIRAAELAATLALGRGDLLSRDRRLGWRRSGLAHVLAVSGLHVGLVGAGVWFLTLIAGARPGTSRLLVLGVLPAYALMAGASPSAIRAALMGMTYLAARQLGRALVPMAAVLIAAIVLLIAEPGLVATPGFQLTVLVTAALLRWAGPVTDLLWGPRWLRVALAVPLVAQVAALPIAAWHFHWAAPGAVVANLAVPVLMAPLLLLSLLAGMAALAAPALAGFLLGLVAGLERALWLAGGPGRAMELAVPQASWITVLMLVAAGWLALQPVRAARWGVTGWLLVVALTGAATQMRSLPREPRVAALPVQDGAAILISTTADTILMDGGRYQDEAALLLVGAGCHHLDAVIASHTDEDHIGGLERVLRVLSVDRLLMPRWMRRHHAAVPLLRLARSRGIQVVPLLRGDHLTVGSSRIEILWPPAGHMAADENERSMVARITAAGATSLLTADIGSSSERRLADLGSLRCDVLVAPHHGSRRSTTHVLLDAARPRLVLIPAAPGNLHNHPHPETLNRIKAHGLRCRWPARDGWCGARLDRGRWLPFP